MPLFINSPLEQFSINSLVSLKGLYFIDMSITNGTLSLFSFIFFIVLLNFLLSEEKKLIGKNWFFLWAQFYKLVLSMILENSGKKGLTYFRFLLSIFSLILFLNLLGMIPYSFAITAHMSLTFSISLSIWLGTVFLGLNLHGINFFSMFLPQNSPLALAIPLILIETVSYLIRPLSLGIRLAANITAGHLLLNLGSSFLYFLLTSSFFILAPLPFILLGIFTFLELAVAFIQSYVFSLLTALYINDSLDLH